MVLNWYWWQLDMYLCTRSSFKIGINNMLLASCNACIIRMWLCQQFFSHTGKIATFKTYKNKQNKLNELTDMIDFGEFPSLSLESLSVVTSIQYVCYLYDDNKLGSSVNELWFTFLPKIVRAEIFYHQLRCLSTSSVQSIDIFWSVCV